jgi:hypothetical protein
MPFHKFYYSNTTVHQFGALGMIGGDPSITKPSYVAFMADYGTRFRTFKRLAWF